MKANETPIPAPTPGIAWTAETELQRLHLLHEQALQTQREALAQRITYGVLGGFGVMIVITYAVLAWATDPIYNRAKDLLLFINPLIGIVIGYYFTKGRAEKAEAAAQTAEGDKRVAEGQAEQAKTETSEAMGALQTLKDAAQDLLSEPAGAVKAKSLDPLEAVERGEPPIAPTTSNPALVRALSQAEQVLARRKPD
jgi:hypothetical protein